LQVLIYAGLSSFTIATLAEQPNLVAPAAISSFANEAVLMPPDALMPILAGMFCLISCTAWMLAPFSAKPVEVFMKSTLSEA